MNHLYLDFETFYGRGYSLSGLTTIGYVHDPRFKVHGVGVQLNDQPAQWLTDMDAIHQFLAKCPRPIALACHNTAFDGYILHAVFGWHPDRYLDTQSMSRGMFPGQSASLKELAKRLWPDDETMRKGDELIQSKDKRDLTQEESDTLGGYCLQDLRLTREAYHLMEQYYPDDELDIIDLTLRMYCEPLLEINTPLVARTKETLEVERENIIARTGVPKSILSSNKQFAEHLRSLGIEVPTKISTTTNEETDALGKSDIQFQELMRDREDLFDLWRGRLAAKSVGEITRCDRFLSTAAFTGSLMPVPLVYYSAHTGRYGGGEKLNLQNLPRKSMLRQALIAPKQSLVYVADSSNIEARMLAWEAGHTALLDQFRNNEDVYSNMATHIYGRPINKYDDPLERFVGKVACIAEGQEVLTDKGLVPIQDITPEHRVWDGTNFCSHGGLIDRGHQQVMTYDGLTATPDHIIYTQTGRKIPLWQAASEMERLEQTGLDGEAIRTGHDHFTGDSPSARLQDAFNKLFILQGAKMDKHGQLVIRQNARLSTLLTNYLAAFFNTGEALRRNFSPLHQPESSFLRALRSEGDIVSLLVESPIYHMGNKAFASHVIQGLGDRSYQQRWRLCGWELEVVIQKGEQQQSPDDQDNIIPWEIYTTLRCVPCTEDDSPKRKLFAAYDHKPAQAGIADRRHSTPIPLATEYETKRTYDLAACGRHNRFTVSGRLVSNCLGLGYGMGHDKFQTTLALGAMGDPVFFSSDEARAIVRTYRTVNAPITRYWAQADSMLARMLDPHTDEQWGALTVRHKMIILPNGMALRYNGLVGEMDHNERVHFEYYNGKYMTNIYGGKLCIAGDTPVLTDAGLVRLRDVAPHHRVWDGENWVTHKGLVYKGNKTTIKAYGVWMTPDHEVLTHDGWKTASQSTQYRRADCRLPAGFSLPRLRREKINLESHLHSVPKTAVSGSDRAAENAKTTGNGKLWMPEKQNAARETQNPRHVKTPRLRRLARHGRPLPTTITRGMEKLWRSGRASMRSLGAILRRFLGGQQTWLPQRAYAGQDRQRWALLPGEHTLGGLPPTSKQSQGEHARSYARRNDDSCGSSKEIRDQRLDNTVSTGAQLACAPATSATERQQPVFDLLDCGPNHRFTVIDEDGQPLIVHNCENITQALARIVLFNEHMLELDAYAREHGGRVVLNVHDEIVVVAPDFGARKTEFVDKKGKPIWENTEGADEFFAGMLNIMRQAPAWCADLPLDAEGGYDVCYSK